MRTGSIALVLHSHIPYCRKWGVWPFGEEWLFEAMAETYIPILDMLAELHTDLGSPVLTLSFTPILLEQLDDDYMNARFLSYLDMRIDASTKALSEHEESKESRKAEIANYFLQCYSNVKASYLDKHGSDLITSIRGLVDRGTVEVLAAPATHAYLPLFRQELSVREQVRIGCEAVIRHLGIRPKGMWLPECGYTGCPYGEDGLSLLDILADNGIEFFFVDSHAVTGSRPIGSYDMQGHLPPGEGQRRTTLQPYRVSGSSLVVYARDEVTAAQVWSRDLGYPGDGVYREFHKRDDRSGLTYWKVTNRLHGLERKELYDPRAAQERARLHAEHFISLVQGELGMYRQECGRPGIVVAPYDMELFGHWWLEGVDWLREVISLLRSSQEVSPVGCGYYLRAHPPTDTIDLFDSSWGQGGGHGVWLNPSTGWMWEEIWKAESVVKELASKAPILDEQGRMCADQAFREFLLLSASDWPFLVTTGQAREYAYERFTSHMKAFYGLSDRCLSHSEGGMTEAEQAIARDEVFSWVHCPEEPVDKLLPLPQGREEVTDIWYTQGDC